MQRAQVSTRNARQNGSPGRPFDQGRSVDRGDRGRLRRGGPPTPEGHGTIGSPPANVPYRLSRRLRLQRRYVDAERGPRRLRLHAHPLQCLRRCHSLLPARAHPRLRHARRTARRSPRPQVAPDRPLARTAPLLAGARPGRPVAAPVPGPAHLRRPAHRDRERHVRPGLLRHPPGLGRARRPPRRHLTQHGTDERVASHRAGPGRRRLSARRPELGLRRQCGDLSLRRRRPLDGVATGNGRGPTACEPLAG